MGHITLDEKCAGARSAGNPHAACDVAGAGNGLTVRLVRYSQRKRGAPDRPHLRSSVPALDPTGRELFYLSSDARRLLSVSIQTQPELEIGEQQILVEKLDLPLTRYSSGAGPYDVSPGGERFLMVLENETAETMELHHVVLNWDQELKRLVPTN